MDVVTSVAQTLFAALECSQLKEIFSMYNYESELDNLKRIVCNAQQVLESAGANTLSKHTQTYIDELKDSVYDADDLLDEFLTIAKQKKDLVMEKGEVRRFFSQFNSVIVARKMSTNVKKIKEKFDMIKENYDKFGPMIDNEPIKLRGEETCSYVNKSDIIGREADVEKLLGELVSSDVNKNNNQACNFLSIVGIGGLGKTALAQLVYNDERVKSEFPSRIWICVSDEKKLDKREILIKILRSATDDRCDNYTLDEVQSRLQQHLADKKFLIVLDDVWTEDREEWLQLERFLKRGEKGSWVLITTRSKETARIVGNSRMHELEGLSLEHSRSLFQMIAFGDAIPPEDLVEMGHQIVDRCANVPLAIRVVGSLLYGQSKNRWRSFKEKGLAYINESKNDITTILKLSYHHLTPSLKSCFSYCAIFPKDSEIEKEMLIALWMAQGYIVPFSEGQSIEDAAEEYFTILLRRCFFQDVYRDEFGEIMGCKMHDLMHDIAQKVAVGEICEVNTNTTGLDERVRHLSVVEENFMKMSPAKNRIRTCLGVGKKDKELLMGLILEKCVRLRTLILNDSEVTLLPETLGNLVHLRYLDLSYNSMLEGLPKSITKLLNLQTLRVAGCGKLKELPKDLGKLHKLRVLDIQECRELKYLPAGMNKLASLHIMPIFLVGSATSNVKECFDQLEGLKALKNLKYIMNIEIQVPKNATYVKEDSRDGAYISNKEHLICIGLFFKHVENYGSVDYEEALLEEMQPHSNLLILKLSGYKGMKLPSWAMKDNLARCLPNLVSLIIKNCEGLQVLPDLRRLRHLEELKLKNLQQLEYVQDENSSVTGYCEQGLLPFPCLERVTLRNLPKLKAWCRGSGLTNDLGDDIEGYQPCFPRMRKMYITGCPKMSTTSLRSHMKNFRILIEGKWRPPISHLIKD